MSNQMRDDISRESPWFKLPTKWGDEAENMPPAPPTEKRPDNQPRVEIEPDMPEIPLDQPENPDKEPDQPRGVDIVDYKI